MEDNSFSTPLSMEAGSSVSDYDDAIGENDPLVTTGGGAGGNARGATVLQTSLNVAKMCMGTGTLALPFAAARGGLVFNAIGLALIGWWNYYAAGCLLRCLEFLPRGDEGGGGGGREKKDVKNGQPKYGSIDLDDGAGTDERERVDLTHPPSGTTAYGRVAWYACGPTGVQHATLDKFAIGYLIPNSHALLVH